MTGFGLLEVARIGVDAVVLALLLRTLSDEDLNFRTAFYVAAVASLGNLVLAASLTAAMGTVGIIVAAIIVALLIALAVSALFGVEIKRSCLIGAIFMLVHIAMGVGGGSMLRF